MLMPPFDGCQDCAPTCLEAEFYVVHQMREARRETGSAEDGSYAIGSGYHNPGPLFLSERFQNDFPHARAKENVSRHFGNGSGYQSPLDA